VTNEILKQVEKDNFLREIEKQLVGFLDELKKVDRNILTTSTFDREFLKQNILILHSIQTDLVEINSNQDASMFKNSFDCGDCLKTLDFRLRS